MIHLSYSELRDYARCPYFYRLKHVDKLKEGPDKDKVTFVGIVLQKLVELFYRHAWWREHDLEWFLTEQAVKLAREMTDAGQVRWSGDEYSKALVKIEHAVPKILATIKAEKLLTTKTYPEEELTLTYPKLWHDGQDVLLHVRPDFVYHAPTLLTVVDGKAGATVGRYGDKDQLRLAALAVERDPRFGRLPDRVGFWWYRHGVVTWVKLTPKTLAACHAEVVTRIRQIDMARFDPKVGSHCRPCGLRLHCEAGKRYGVSKPPTKGRPALDLPGNAGVISF